MLQEKKPDEALEDEFGQKKKLALLDVLLQSQVDGKPLTNNDIREEIDTFMFEVFSSVCFLNIYLIVFLWI